LERLQVRSETDGQLEASVLTITRICISPPFKKILFEGQYDMVLSRPLSGLRSDGPGFSWIRRPTRSAGPVILPGSEGASVRKPDSVILESVSGCALFFVVDAVAGSYAWVDSWKDEKPRKRSRSRSATA